MSGNNLLVLLLVVICGFQIHQLTALSYNNVSTIVGGGSRIGDELTGTNAMLNYPSDLALLNDNLFIADSFNMRIRKVSFSSAMKISTFAGVGSSSFSGDGGLAVSAELNYPSGVAVHSNGDVFIADKSTHVIRKVYSNGTIVTIAGIPGQTVLNKFSNSLATNTTLNSPQYVAVNSLGELFISDTNNNVIRKVFTNGTIITIAGVYASSGFSGDNGVATSAKLYNPKGIVVNSIGEIYFADFKNHRIRKVSTNGKISTIAGTGTAGYSGDGGLATSAKLNYPNGVSIGLNDEIYIADTYNQVIRKIFTNGTITTIAGNSTQRGFSGDGGNALSAVLNLPYVVKVASNGEYYISDYGNQRIRKVSTSGIITTIVGTSTFGNSIQGSSAFALPTGNPIIYSTKYLAFADSNGKIRQVDLTTKLVTNVLSVPLPSAVGYRSKLYAMYLDSYLGSLSTKITVTAGTGKLGGFSGDGSLATSARLQKPTSVVLYGQDLYIIDNLNHRIRKVSLKAGNITTIAGIGSSGFSGDGGLATKAKLSYPTHLAISSSGEIFISDTGNQRIRKIATNGKISTIAGTGVAGFSGDGGLATKATFNNPHGIAISSNGDVYVADSRNLRIRKISVSNGFISTFAGNGSVAYQATFGGDGGLAVSAKLYLPYSVAINNVTNEVYIADSGNHRIRKVSTSGIINTIAGTGSSGFSGDNGLATNAKLNFPYSITINSLGELFIADQLNMRIRKVSTTNYITTIGGNGGVGFNGDNLSATGTQLKYPCGITASSSEVYFADSLNSRVRKILNGKITTVAGGIGDELAATSAYLNSNSFAITSTGEFIVADSFNSRVRKISTSGIISTIAGTGISGFGGDNSNATLAQLNNPMNVAVNSNNEIFIVDTNNHRIRKMFLNGTIVTIAGNGTAGFSGDGLDAKKSQLNYPSALAISSNEIFIVDSNNHRIRKIASDGTISTIVGNGISGFNGDGNLPINTQLSYPSGIAIASSGELYISDEGNTRIRKIHV